MRKSFLLLSLFATINLFAQPAAKNDAWKKLYRGTPIKINSLIHTKLEANFDYTKSYLNGKVWLTLQPHFYATDSLQLDAKGMNINTVVIVKNNKQIPLKYTYDSLVLNITLDKKYTAAESYTVYIDYTAKPNEFLAEGSAAITDAKGLYFINPTGEDKTKPTQIWTQGETEATSVWVPTIDKTNQKSTTDFYLTVPSKYVSLSNGKLISQINNNKGLRTDYWKMDQPHAPYLFFIGIGDYNVIKDTYKGKEVNYYVEKEYAPVAKQIFGLTPKMMEFFSTKTGVEYPWIKYSQIVGRDYVSGAMENTTATLHQESAYQNARELTDGNRWESTIAHELFHQWFGDYVTAESWSNITVNESFANYSETLWDEYQHGADAGADQNFGDMSGYLGSGSADKDLVRFFYSNKEDVFDAVSYNKGGRILHMLRHYVGDDAFFKSLNLYLTTNKFGTGSAHKLRLAFETVTGKDLNWYFSQWYFGSGHPKVEISYNYNVENKLASVIIKQTQTGDKIFKMPIDIDVYSGFEKKRTTVFMSNKVDTFNIGVQSKPDLINVDGDKILLWEKKDDKSTAEFIHQYKFAKNYVDRREAINYCNKHRNEPAAFELLKTAALTDPYFKLRNRSLDFLSDTTLPTDFLSSVVKLIEVAKDRQVKPYALDLLSKTNSDTYKRTYLQYTTDSSYTVAGAALEALAKVDEEKAISLLPTLQKDARGRLKTAVESVAILTKGDADFDAMTKDFTGISGLQEKFTALGNYIDFLAKVNNTNNFKKGVDEVITFRTKVAQYGVAPQINAALKAMAAKKLSKKSKATNPADIDVQLDYVAEKTKE